MDEIQIPSNELLAEHVPLLLQPGACREAVVGQHRRDGDRVAGIAVPQPPRPARAGHPHGVLLEQVTHVLDGRLVGVRGDDPATPRCLGQEQRADGGLLAWGRRA